MPGPLPDWNKIFDLLLKREGPFQPSVYRYNSLLYYIPALVYHDLFFFTRDGENLAPPYLDLSFLYGKTKEEQNTIRSFENGFLKRDAFTDNRFVLRPPGIVACCLAASKFH